MNNDKPRIGITIGDFNGIGPEIIIKSLSNSKLFKHCTPIVYANYGIFSQYKKTLKIEDFNLNKVQNIDKLNDTKGNIFQCWDEDHKINVGIPTEISGKCAFKSIEIAVQDLKNKKIDAVITAPIDKDNIQSDSFNFPGHTEYLIQQFEAKKGLMILTSDKLTVASVTGHIAIKDVPSKITKENIIDKAKALHSSLRKDFGCQKPKIAILGLNPHASDNGLFGNEEEKEIIPAIQQLKEDNILAFGPYPPDGYFGKNMFEKFDATLGMYHDQVLIPFKLIDFESGVNFTSGLSGVRTSPDHGTAFDIAGKNQANHHSFLNAIFKAIDIINERRN